MLPLPEATRHCTYLDHLSWPDDVRYELIDGQPVLTSPPTVPTLPADWPPEPASRTA